MKISVPQALEAVQKKQLNQMIEEAQVKDFLIKNPKFLKDNPQLLTYMDFGQEKGNMPSLVERQIKVLRERNQTFQGQLIDMLGAAHNNEALLIRCNNFMLKLLRADSLPELTDKIISLVKQEFDLDGAALVLVGSYPATPFAQIMSHPSEIKKLLNCQFPDNQPLCGRLGSEPNKALFKQQAKDLKSFALIPLGEQCEFGLLALASKEVTRFEPHMGTLFIELIAKLIVHLTSRYAPQ